MFDVDPVETGLDSGMLMYRLVANDFPSMPECSIRAFMTWVEGLSKKYGDTAMAQTNDTKQEGRGESALLWVPQKDTIMQKNIPLNHVETQTYPIGEADKDEQKTSSCRSITAWDSVKWEIITFWLLVVSESHAKSFSRICFRLLVLT